MFVGAWVKSKESLTIKPIQAHQTIWARILRNCEEQLLNLWNHTQKSELQNVPWFRFFYIVSWMIENKNNFDKFTLYIGTGLFNWLCWSQATL